MRPEGGQDLQWGACTQIPFSIRRGTLADGAFGKNYISILHHGKGTFSVVSLESVVVTNSDVVR